MLVVWLRIEGYALEMLTTLVAHEAFGMESRAGGRNNTTGNRQGTLRTKSSGAHIGRGPMRAVGRTGTTKWLRRMIPWVG
jgi:hypothetical protein